MLDQQLLDRLTATWRSHGAPIEDALAPGRTVEAFTSDDGDLHVDLPEELRTWWGWHDGGIEEDGRPVRPYMMGPVLTPLSSTRSRKSWQRMLVEAAEAATDEPEGTEAASRDYWWQEAWVPLFSDGAGDIVADCKLDSAGATPIRRIEWGYDDGPSPPATDSLGQLIEWWIEAIDNGLWTFDRDRGVWLPSHDNDPAVEQRYGGLI